MVVEIVNFEAIISAGAVREVEAPLTILVVFSQGSFSCSLFLSSSMTIPCERVRGIRPILQCLSG